MDLNKVSLFGMMKQRLAWLGQRQEVLAQNIANADTPGYRRKLISFESAMDGARDTGQVEVGRLTLDQTELRQTYNPAHPMADEQGYLTMSNVDVITEIADAREAQRSFEANMNMFDQARRMYSSVLQLLKR